MSVTMTDNPTATQLHRVLDDYNIHLTGSEPAAVNPRSSPPIESPANWPQDYHNVPVYRPINRHLDFAERPNGTNPVETLFIYVMLRGVWVNATAAQTWHKTGGRINDRIFRYKVGGEW